MSLYMPFRSPHTPGSVVTSRILLLLLRTVVDVVGVVLRPVEALPRGHILALAEFVDGGLQVAVVHAVVQPGGENRARGDADVNINMR